MLNNLFKRPTIVRMEQGDYDAMKSDNAKLHKLIDEWERRTAQAKAERDKAEHERDVAERESDASDKAVLIAVEQRDIARKLLTRALTQLSKVDTTRIDGKQLQASITNLLAEAKEHGLWGEVQ